MDKNKSILNGHSLSHLTGATTVKTVETEIRLPASSMVELIEKVQQLGQTGALQVNFNQGRAVDIVFKNRMKTTENPV